MDKPLPPGYRRLIALDSDRHRGVGVRTADDYRFAAQLNALYLTVTEFFQAVRHYPVAFARDAVSAEVLPLAITGLAAGQNLFVDSAGRWAAGVYVPAYVRRYPFFTVELPEQQDEGPRAVVCVDEPALDPEAPPLFDAQGAPTEQWQRRERFINDMENARRQTREFTRSLESLELLEPFEAHAQPQGGQALQLRGLLRVSETRLNALSGEELKAMMSRGELSRIYAHLISLENFALLLDRVAARGDRPPAAAGARASAPKARGEGAKAQKKKKS